MDGYGNETPFSIQPAPVDQRCPVQGDATPVGTGVPWHLLGVWNLPNGMTLGVKLTDGGDTSGDQLCVGDAMVCAIWPTVSIRPADVAVNPNVPEEHAGDYADWVAACAPAYVPLEGYGDRVPFQLNASIDSLYGDVSQWHAQLGTDPAETGLEFWTSATGGSAITAAQFSSNLISSGNYSGTVWVSSCNGQDPSILLHFLCAAIGADASQGADAQPVTPDRKGFSAKDVVLHTQPGNLFNFKATATGLPPNSVLAQVVERTTTVSEIDPKSKQEHRLDAGTEIMIDPISNGPNDTTGEDLQGLDFASFIDRQRNNIRFTHVYVDATLKVYVLDKQATGTVPAFKDGFKKFTLNGKTTVATDPPVPGGNPTGEAIATSTSIISYTYHYDLDVKAGKATLTFSGADWKGLKQYTTN
jgi:hypothetical protein